jgi:hypothetical protein
LAAQTNNPVTLAALFPGLVVGSSTYYLTNIPTPNIVSYFTNYYGEPAGTPPHLITVTNGYSPNIVNIYTTTFANLVLVTNYYPNSYHTNTPAQLVTVNGTPNGTNTTIKSITLTNVASGDYYLIPPGTCGPSIISVLATNVTTTTNLITSATNSGGNFYSQSVVIYSTNHIFAVYPCTLVTNSPGSYQGIQRVRFVRLPDDEVDPLTWNLRHPFTTNYTMVFYNPTNSQLYTQTFQRTVTTPDILLTAQDGADGPAGINFNNTVVRTTPNYDVGNILPGLRGPGVINSPSTFTYNKVGDIFFNGPISDTNAYLYEVTHFKQLQWASFDGSTNDPVIYGNGASIQNLENQMVVSISPTTLPDGTNNQTYATTTFAVTGGQPPFTWSLVPGGNFPHGLNFSSGGTISGTPGGNAEGTYDFAIQLNDSAARTIQWSFPINIH